MSWMARWDLKWPNDLVAMTERRDTREPKLGGILSEASGDVVVIGLGVNLYWPEAPKGMSAVFEVPSLPRANSNTHRPELG